MDDFMAFSPLRTPDVEKHKHHKSKKSHKHSKKKSSIPDHMLEDHTSDRNKSKKKHKSKHLKKSQPQVIPSSDPLSSDTSESEMNRDILGIAKQISDNSKSFSDSDISVLHSTSPKKQSNNLPNASVVDSNVSKQKTHDVSGSSSEEETTDEESSEKSTSLLSKNSISDTGKQSNANSKIASKNKSPKKAITSRNNNKDDLLSEESSDEPSIEEANDEKSIAEERIFR